MSWRKLGAQTSLQAGDTSKFSVLRSPTCVRKKKSTTTRTNSDYKSFEILMEKDSPRLQPHRTLFRCTTARNCRVVSYSGEEMARHQRSHLLNKEIARKRRYCSVCNRIYANIHQHLTTPKHNKKQKLNQSSGSFFFFISALYFYCLNI